MPTYRQKPDAFEAIQLTDDASLAALADWLGENPQMVQRTYPGNDILSAVWASLALGGGPLLVHQGSYVTALGDNFATTLPESFEAQFEQVEN